MSDEDALLSAIAVNPAEDTPRLVYADWLDEHDQPIRAEFIRLQIEIARLRWLSPGDRGVQYERLQNRNRELLTEYRHDLLGSLATVQSDFRVEFDRGFLTALTMYAGVFLEHGAQVAAIQPAPLVTVTGVVDRWYDLFTDKFLPLVTQLVMQDRRFNSQPQPLDASIIRRLGELGQQNRLQVLNLAGSRVGDQGLLFLVEHAGTWRYLTELDLSGNDIYYLGLHEFLDSPITRQLRRLSLADNPLTEMAVTLLARSWPVGSPLEILDVSDTDIGVTERGILRERFGRQVTF